MSQELYRLLYEERALTKQSMAPKRKNEEEIISIPNTPTSSNYFQ